MHSIYSFLLYFSFSFILNFILILDAQTTGKEGNGYYCIYTSEISVCQERCGDGINLFRNFCLRQMEISFQKMDALPHAKLKQVLHAQDMEQDHVLKIAIMIGSFSSLVMKIQPAVLTV